MNALACAWRSLVRQPARTSLGIIGVAAVGALLFDMLLLSEGLIISTRNMLDSMPFDIRVTSTDQMPGRGPDVLDGPAAAAQIAALPSVSAVTTLRREDAYLMREDSELAYGSVLGVGGDSGRPWTLVSGADVTGDNEIVINEFAAQVTGAEPGSTLTVRSNCADGATSPPAMEFRVTGIATFVFDVLGEAGAGMTDTSLAESCGTPGAIPADFLMVRAAGDPASTAADIDALSPQLLASTNDDAMGQLQQRGFTYFRQISTVLTTITMSFALLLITVLLTVSVNQRLGEVAALRALGFSQGRVVLDVLWESVLIVGIGGVLSLPLGGLMAVWLDGILKRMPRIPVDVHFFVFQPDTVWMHAALMAVTALTAAIYPMLIVARLPIATTLRNEVVG
jgi:putative ABC transport system permease protein